MAEKRKKRRQKGGRRKVTGRATGGAGSSGLVKQLRSNSVLRDSEKARHKK